MSITCPICNVLMQEGSNCSSCIHEVGKYTVSFWYDGEVRIYGYSYDNRGYTILVLHNLKHITEEYIDKIMLLK
jgi:hypothetical protein